MKLTIHIGGEKTGTKTLQSWFASNREALRERGVLYPRSLGQTIHRDLATYATDGDKPDDGFRRRNINSEADHEAFRAQLSADFDAELAANTELAHCFVSSEHLQSRLTTVEMVNRVRAFFGDRFESATIFIHLRPQIDVAVSLASTGARGGFSIGPRWFAPKKEDHLYHNHDLLVQRWEQVFGAENIVLVPFIRQPSLIEPLLARFGISGDGLSAPERQNEALDWRTVAIIKALATEAKDETARGNVTGDMFVDDWPVEEKLEIGLDVARRFQEVWEASNLALIARRPELKDGDLTPDWSKYNTPSRLDELDHALPFAPQLGYAFGRLRSELLLERCGRCLAEARLALLQDEKERARSVLKEAQKALKHAREDVIDATRLASLQSEITNLRTQARA